MSLKSPVSAVSRVEAKLHYLAPMADKPFTYTYEPVGVPSHNTVYDERTLAIHNARPVLPLFDLERHGFTLLDQPTAARDLYDEDEVRRTYYPEAEHLLQQLTGADRVIVFDHNIRNRARLGEKGVKEPVKRVHVDFTVRSGHSRGRSVLSALGTHNPDSLLAGRFAVVNLWRPIARPVEESPLAVCSADSIAGTDLVAADLVYRDRVGETYLLTYNLSHRWFYFPQMSPDEVLLIKCFDSAEGGPARFAAHTAFDDPTSPPDAPPRASIELRSLVFYPD